MAIAAVFRRVDGLQAVATGALRGCGRTRVSFVASVFAHWAVGAPVIWWLVVRCGRGAEGVWWGPVAGLSVAAVTLIATFLGVTRRQVLALDVRQ